MAKEAILEIADYHNDVVLALRSYFKQDSLEQDPRFIGYTTLEIAGLLAARIEETDLRSALAILTTLEAAFRVDFELRCQKRMKDSLSKIFRSLQKQKGRTISLDEDIFAAWRQSSIEFRRVIGELRGAFRYRHWLAHGRYWVPKLGSKTDFNVLYMVVDA